jgi:excisionase family DNA binding protein
MVDVETKTTIKLRRKEQMEKTTMSVQELSAQMGISLPKAYELVKSPGFPTIRIGTRILIPVDAYKEWLFRNSARR